MFEHFKNLTEKESSLVVDAIAYITVLIAGADGKINKEEKEWANKITEIRSYNLPAGLKDYYKIVGESFQEKLDKFIEDLPEEVDARNMAISSELSQLTEILPKMNRNFSMELAKSYRTFAKHVARASGGFLGFNTINLEERNLIGLDMIKYPE